MSGGKLAAVGVTCLALFLGLMAVVAGVLGGTLACTSWPAAAAGNVTAGPDGSVSITQANIPMRTKNFAATLRRAVSDQPDFVALQEVSGRRKAQLQPRGYAVQRGPATRPVGQTRSTAVLWRTDRWRKVAGGRILMVPGGPQKWDAGRSATWATLEATDGGGRVSIVSVHHMINPKKFGPKKKRRQRLYAAGMVKLRSLVAQLSAAGPVFVAGDFNSRWSDNDPWGPRKMLADSGMRSTRDVLGKIPAYVDYIFYQGAAAEPVRHAARPTRDHPVVSARFKFTPSLPSTSPSPTPSSAGEKPPAIGGYSGEQLRNAAAILAAGREIDVPARAQTIALMTAMGESSLRVLDYGDDAGPDSRGLFQQRDNGAWGTLEDRMDPRRSSLMFYNALLKVPGWQNMEPTIAAHKTQRNADPYHYTKYWKPALRLFAVLTGSSAISDALFNGATNDCDQAALSAGSSGDGSVVYPIPASMKGSDRKNWGQSGGRWSSVHTGTDFSVACGTPVYAAHAGTIEIDRGAAWAGPQLVKVSTGRGKLTTWYAHMQTATVNAGQSVTAGEKIGEVGSEGNSTGCHLHFEVHPNGGSIYEDHVDPSAWLTENVKS